jgi:tetratricopeptide (TPR) repeat protein
MRRFPEIVWRWRWAVTAAAVMVLVIGYVLRWRAEQSRIARLLAEGEAALAERDYGSAREHFNAYLESRPEDSRARLLAARAARRLRKYDQAAEDLAKCRAAGGEAEAVEVEFALMDVERGDERPVPELRARVAQKDDELSLAILEVLIQFDLDLYRLRDALQGFNLYLARRPGDLYALVGRGQLWERLLSFADAVIDYRAAVAAHPENDRARRRLAAALLIVGTPAEALDHYRRLAEQFPHDGAVRLGLAKCYRQLNRADESRALLDDLLADPRDNSSPDRAEVLWERGQIELDRGRPAEAEPWLRRADRDAPFDRRIVFSLFNCLQALDRVEEAEAVKKRMTRIDDDLRRLDAIRQQVMTNPTNAALRVEGGKIFVRNGERDEGIRWLKLALQFDPKHEEARLALAAALAAP